MKRPETIWEWNLPDTKQVPDGCDWKTVADVSEKNMQILIDRHNELVELVLLLAGRAGIEFEGEAL